MEVFGADDEDNSPSDREHNSPRDNAGDNKYNSYPHSSDSDDEHRGYSSTSDNEQDGFQQQKPVKNMISQTRGTRGGYNKQRQ